MGKYDDIINLPHHRSIRHPHMSIHDRAAQFSAFKALSGYEAAIQETGRLTDERKELDETAKAVLDAKLQMIRDHIGSASKVSITYFSHDIRKSGGAYRTIVGHVKKIDSYQRMIIMTDSTSIRIDDLFAIEFA